MCCSDIHLVGPISRTEATQLRRLVPGSVVFTDRADCLALATGPEHTCVFLHGGRCGLHGTRKKPAICRQFPFSLIATPLGARVTTAHRCTCRLLGDRPLIDLREARASLSGSDGKVRATARVGDRIPLSPRTSISFSSYACAEAPLLERLAAGEAPSAVLGVPPSLPTSRGPTWAQVAETFRGGDVGTGGFHAAMACFGHGLRLLRDNTDAAPPRPWAPWFDAAEAAAPVPETASAVLGDWAADMVWDLRWAVRSSFDVLCMDLQVRWMVASALANRWQAEGARADRAAAEAVLVVDSVGEAPLWRQALPFMSHQGRWSTRMPLLPV